MTRTQVPSLVGKVVGAGGILYEETVGVLGGCGCGGCVGVRAASWEGWVPHRVHSPSPTAAAAVGCSGPTADRGPGLWNGPGHLSPSTACAACHDPAQALHLWAASGWSGYQSGSWLYSEGLHIRPSWVLPPRDPVMTRYRTPFITWSQPYSHMNSLPCNVLGPFPGPMAPPCLCSKTSLVSGSCLWASLCFLTLIWGKVDWLRAM